MLVRVIFNNSAFTGCTILRYSDLIPSGEAVMAVTHETMELMRQSETENDDFSQSSVSFQAEFTATSERWRPRFIISKG